MEGQVRRSFFIFLFFIFLINQNGMAQTCCSGGVPLASNLGLPPSNKKTIQFRVSYDLNVLETIKSGREKLNDDSRSRRTHSGLFEIGYSFSNRFSLDAFFSFVRQVREINQFGNRDYTATNGVGDALILFKYKLYSNADNSKTFTTGLGIKAPLGPSDLRNEIGLAIIADLQSGSGSWDGIFWNQYTQQLAVRQSMSLSAVFAYSLKGENPNYLGNENYRFGNELQLGLGLTDRVFINNLIFDPSLEIRYRKSGKDTLNNSELPSTSGDWVFLSPGLSYWFNPNCSLNTSLSLPVFSDIEGTQLTPSWRFNFGFYSTFSLK